MSTARGDALVRVPSSTGWVERDGVVYAARLPDGPPLVLAGPAVLVWQSLVDGGTLAQVQQRVAAATGESVAGVRPGVVGFLAGLADAGVVVVEPPPPDGR